VSEDTKRELSKGCVVFMKGSSGLIGYGNPQCVSDVHHKSLGTISLYGHNQHYKTYDIDRIVEYPVHACNGHKDLVAACQGLADAFPESDAGDLDAADFKDRAALTFIAVRKAKAALAKE